MASHTSVIGMDAMKVSTNVKEQSTRARVDCELHLRLLLRIVMMT